MTPTTQPQRITIDGQNIGSDRHFVSTVRPNGSYLEMVTTIELDGEIVNIAHTFRFVDGEWFAVAFGC